MSMRPIGLGRHHAARPHLAPEEDDPAFAQKLRRFIDGLERAIHEANRKVIGRELQALDSAAFLRLAVRVAELRARYIGHGLKIAEGHPRPAEIQALAEHRLAYEEMMKVFEAAERTVERAYIKLPD